MVDLLECGHPESDHSDITRGYGRDSEGNRHCYDCCLEIEKESMRKTGQVFAYHSGYSVTIWPGNVISNDVYVLSHSMDNFGGERTYLRFMFEGEIWSGFSMGEGMYLRARRTKLKSLYQ